LCISRVLQRLTLRAERSPLSYADKLTITLDQWQRDVLSSQARQMLLNVTRQGGKSTISALLGLATIMAEEDQLVLIISPGERQSKLLFQKLMRFYHQLGRPVPAQTVNKLSLELINGSQVHALPGEEGTIRGFSGVNLLLMDEASRIRDEMNAAVRPMLAVSGGRTVAMSTPWGKRGWWWEAWEQGGTDWERYEVNVYQCPRIPADFIAQERRTLPAQWFASEYMCEFVEPDDAVFTEEQIRRAFGHEDIEPLFELSPGLDDLALEEGPEALTFG
jgi:hypothetical protein